MRLFNAFAIVAFLIVSTAILIAAGASAIEEDPPPIGDWFIDGAKNYTGKTGLVDGSLVVGLGSSLTIEDSVLTIKINLLVEIQGTLVIRNSTIKLNCIPSEQNRIELMDQSTVTITDTDNDRFTEFDRSVITSATSLNYNFTASPDSTLNLRNSLIDRCGRYGADAFAIEGLHVMSDLVTIEGTNFTRGYFGAILDQVNGVRINNCSFIGNTIGILLVGTRDCDVSSNQFIDNSMYSVQIRGFHGNMIFRDNQMRGDSGTHLNMAFTSGFTNEITSNTIGPGGQVGIRTEEVDGYSFKYNTVDGCEMGWSISTIDTDIFSTRVANCTQGIKASVAGNIRFDDLVLLNTSVTVDPAISVNMTFRKRVKWERVTGDLACSLYVDTNGILEMDGVDISFRDSGIVPNGILVVKRATIMISNSNFESGASGHMFCILEDDSQIQILDTTFKDLGFNDPRRRMQGLFIAGSGTLNGLTISDSLNGLVIGRALARLDDLSILDCDVGILVDGDLGRGGTMIDGLTVSGCNVAIRAVNSGSMTINEGDFDLAGEGFNLSSSTVTLRDSRVGQPRAGNLTANLVDTSTLDFINCSTSKFFNFGPLENTVNIYWYLNLTLKFLSDGSPLSDALVSAREATGTNSIRDADSGPTGYLDRLALREMSLTPNQIDSTPHTITVTKGALRDTFSITMDRSKDHTFLMDNYPPVLTILNPVDGMLFNVSTITIMGEARDAMVTEHEGLKSLTYQLDNGTWLPIPLPSVKDWSFEVIVEDGFHVVTVEVEDEIGNVATETVTFEVDTQAPPLTILSPIGHVLTNQSSLLILGKSEPGAVVTVNGVEVALSVGGDFNVTVALDEGLNTIVVSATDSNGNTGSMMIMATLDTTAPVVDIDAPPGEWWTSSSTVTIEGTKELDTKLFVDTERPEFFASDTFSVEVTLTEGINSFAIIAIDGSLNQWSTTVFIYMDGTAPVLTVNALPMYSKQASVVVTGTVDDPDASVSINGQAIVLTGTVFAHTISLIDGLNSFTVEAVDDLGNTAQPVTVEVTLDTVPPSLDISTKRFIQTFQDEQNLSGTSDPGVTVVVSVVYGAYTKTYPLVAGDDGTFQVEVRLPQLGNHTVTVTAEDAAGNRIQDHLNFNRIRPNVQPPPPPPGDSWFADNWEWVVLAVSMLASVVVLYISMKPRNRAPSRPIDPAADDEEADQQALEEEPEEDWEEDEGEEPWEEEPEE